MRATATTDAPRDTAADTVAIGLFEDEGVAHDLEGGRFQTLIDQGEAKRTFKHLALDRADGKRWILAGLGPRADFTPERARVAAATVHARAKELGTKIICWELPHHTDPEGFVEGTLLAEYAFTRYKSDDPPSTLTELLVSAHHDVTEQTERAAITARAQNAARDLQNTPANDMTPSLLAERAREIAGVTTTVERRDEIVARGMGAFAAVAQGTYEEPALITMRYEPEKAAAGTPVLGLVGKAVTFDTGGISLKPSAKMSEMKFDMSGGAAVIEAMGAIAQLGLPLRVVAVVGATENMPSGRSVKPGDIVRAKNGLTIEVNNTDAEGRLVLADCLTHAIDEGAERLVDVATLTGAIIIALGSTYAGLVSDDDAWAEQVLGAGRASGELAWRLPLHEEFAELVKGQYGDLNNAPEARKAGSITAGEFLKRFTGDVPWAHLDIAGTAWDQGRPYAAKGGTGTGVRLLVELASALAEPAGAPAPA